MKDFLPFGVDAYYGTQISNGICHWVIETAGIEIQLSITNAINVPGTVTDNSFS